MPGSLHWTIHIRIRAVIPSAMFPNVRNFVQLDQRKIKDRLFAIKEMIMTQFEIIGIMTLFFGPVMQSPHNRQEFESLTLGFFSK